MRLSLLLCDLYLATAVVAGGYQGALERVLLYYAYQIDGLNDPSYRQLGYKCVSWQKDAGECKDNNWEQYKCTALDDPNEKKGKRCNFWQLMTNLGETRGGNNAKLMMPEGVDANAKTLPIEKTAVSYYMYTREHMPDVNSAGEPDKGKVGDYQPYKFLKYGETNYNDWLGQLGDIVQSTAKAKKSDANKWMFEEFQNTVKQIRAARIGDNGRFVVAEYKKNASMDNKNMVTDNPGTNPATKSEYKNLDWYENHRGEWIEFNWAETQNEMDKNGVKEADKKMATFRNKYFESESARQHQAVMNEFELIERKVTGCR
ncbi:uncharacterized protein J7T54_005048 [Emericellopsis cladophorae]|uniref:Uncharacterized protein n=1 Tax=Emericellopsis cladophorae TaxID=2686198 RepID=A0A9P9XVF1_9HYPO|nr:uncharacterized protein J7T54_005048 [Emericellopsis cladophorae]KAI6778524.1 hypothetical protein J7T54_005048 [Emericellopsis cladophorae]